MLIRKKNFISILESFVTFKNPKVKLEQYTTDSISTSDFVYFIGLDNADLVDKLVIDIGAGTGKLGLACLIYGARFLISIEKDDDAIEVLKENSENLDLNDRHLILKLDVDEFVNKYQSDNKIGLEFFSLVKEKLEKNDTYQLSSNDLKELNVTCISNPPFGVHKKGADRSFLNLGTKLGSSFYSIHLSNLKNRKFIERFVNREGWIVSSIHSQKLILKNVYKFHSKPQKQILTDIFKFIKKEDV